MNKAVSVLIPAYNAEKYIEACLTSIANQTFTNFEVIVSNDGSTDNTLDKIEVFKSEYSDIDIKVISNPNGGVSLARKRALEVATGEWITFVDADDTLPSNSLADLCLLANDDTDFVVGFPITPPRMRNCLKWRILASRHHGNMLCCKVLFPSQVVPSYIVAKS